MRESPSYERQSVPLVRGLVVGGAVPAAVRPKNCGLQTQHTRHRQGRHFSRLPEQETLMLSKHVFFKR